MESNYILMANSDPSDEQLAQLMREVSKDVKDRALKAEQNFKNLVATQIEIALLRNKK